VKPESLFDLSGRIALVTGASGTLGRQFALALVNAGATVLLAGRSREKLEVARRALDEAGGRFATVTIDVTQSQTIAEALEKGSQAFGPPDILVNNAGTAGMKFAVDLSDSDWDRVMNVNLRGAFLVAQAFARARIASGGGGTIVNVASITGMTAPPAIAAYAVSKAAVIQMTRVLAREWARHSIRVNALCPGYFESDMTSAYLQTPEGQRMTRAIPMRRTGRPGELDGALLLLASDAGSYMTGATIVIDGGHILVTP
jgi:NAD(P)-dependent dehydrogenase (short-subunit alcohol dehydrogenase family)